MHKAKPRGQRPCEICSYNQLTNFTIFSNVALLSYVIRIRKDFMKPLLLLTAISSLFYNNLFQYILTMKDGTICKLICKIIDIYKQLVSELLYN